MENGRTHNPLLSDEALRIALLYGLLGLIWIVLSDRLVSELVPDAKAMSHFQSFKGGLFVTATSLVIWWLVRRALHRARSLQEEHQKELEQIFKAMPEALIFTDPERRIAQVNPAFVRIFGYEPAEVIGRTTEMLYAQRRDFLRQGQTRFNPGAVTDFEPSEIECRRKGGEVFTGEIVGSPISDGEGRIIGMLGLVRDMTTRKRMEAELEETRNVLQAALDQSPAGIAIADAPDGRVRYVNEAGLALRGGGRAAIVNGIDIGNYVAAWQLLDLDGRPLRDEEVPLARAIMFGETSSREVLIKREDGELRTVLGNAAPIRDETGAVKAGLVVFTDITERIRAQEESRELQDKLHQAQKIESVGDLAGGVAHDFNNMLGVILGHTELALADTDASHPLYGALLDIQKAAQHSAALTQQLLAFARREVADPRLLDLNRTIEEMLGLLRRLLREDLELAWRPAADLGAVLLDPGQVNQILTNLCLNARDAITGVGTITIETGATSFDADYCASHPGFVPGSFVMLAVSDNGCGMDPATRSQVFEPFFTTKEAGQGTGLGLAVVYGIIRQNRGFVTLYSEPGQGTTVRVYFPRQDAAPDDDGPQSEISDLQGGGETILLVEDQVDLLRLGRTMLERLGYHVLAAGTPTRALELAAAYPDDIHLLMTDVVMPDMDGLALARELQGRFPHSRQLFMSGYTANVLAPGGMLNDGVHFLQKPFTVEELARKVREVLGGE